MKTPIPATLATLMYGLFSLPASATSTLYRCTEANGKVTYSDAKCDERGNRGKESALEVMTFPPPLPPTPPKTPAPAAAKAAPPARDAQSRRPFYNQGKPPMFRFFYDPKDAPVEFTNAVVGAAIQKSGLDWSAHCRVAIKYAGIAANGRIAPGEGVMVRWIPKYTSASHPGHEGVGIAGTGSIDDGIKLSPKQRGLQSTLTHEMGHVLGLPHFHEDKTSIMSYDRDYALPPMPSASDYRHCNLIMQKNYGVDIGEVEQETGSGREKMSDRKFLEKKFGPEKAR